VGPRRTLDPLKSSPYRTINDKYPKKKRFPIPQATEEHCSGIRMNLRTVTNFGGNMSNLPLSGYLGDNGNMEKTYVR
jgi:hypothetical protein